MTVQKKKNTNKETTQEFVDYLCKLFRQTACQTWDIWENFSRCPTLKVLQYVTKLHISKHVLSLLQFHGLWLWQISAFEHKLRLWPTKKYCTGYVTLNRKSRTASLSQAFTHFLLIKLKIILIKTNTTSKKKKKEKFKYNNLQSENEL